MLTNPNGAIAVARSALSRGGSMKTETDIYERVPREFETLGGDNWRCEHCKYAFAIDGGDDARIKMCADCTEERRMYEDEDREWMCFEVPSVSCLTKEWD
jgi:hypothetical protein